MRGQDPLFSHTARPALLTFPLSRCLMGYERSAAREHGQVSLRHGEGHRAHCRGRKPGQWTGELVGCIIGRVRNEWVVLHSLLAGRGDNYMIPGWTLFDQTMLVLAVLTGIGRLIIFGYTTPAKE